MATHSSILAWRIPRTEDSGGLWSIVSHRVGQDWSDLACIRAHIPPDPTHTLSLVYTFASVISLIALLSLGVPTCFPSIGIGLALSPICLPACLSVCPGIGDLSTPVAVHHNGDAPGMLHSQVNRNPTTAGGSWSQMPPDPGPPCTALWDMINNVFRNSLVFVMKWTWRTWVRGQPGELHSSVKIGDY